MAPRQADEADFLQWQRQMAVDRSRGHFFKGLYTADADGAPRRRLSVRPYACTCKRRRLARRKGDCRIVATVRPGSRIAGHTTAAEASCVAP